MNYCPHCGEAMSDSEDRHHGFSVMSPSVIGDAIVAANSCPDIATSYTEVVGDMSGENMLRAAFGDAIVDGKLDVFRSEG